MSGRRLTYVVRAAVVLCVLSADLVWGQGKRQADTPPPDPPISAERVASGIARPARLWLPPEATPHFRAGVVVEDWPLETVLDAVRRELAGDVVQKRPVTVGSTPPLVSIDLLQLATSVTARLNAARRSRSERNARREVQEALAEFCATHDCSRVEEDSSASR